MKKFTPRPIDRISSVEELVYSSAERFGDKPLYIYVEDKEQHTFSYNEHKSSFDALRAALIDLGLAGKKISLCSDQHPDWITAFLSVIGVGGVIVPLDRELQPEQLSGFISITESEAVFLSEREYKLLSPYFDSLPLLRRIVIIGARPDAEIEDERVILFDDLIEKGKVKLSEGADPSACASDVKELACILFTSGTTGTSKGVMLSEYNLLFSVIQCCRMVANTEKDVFVSVLPIHHTFALTTNHLAMSYLGGTTFMNDSLKHTFKNITEVKPTCLILVPLFLETMDKKIWDNVRKQGKEKQVRALMKASNAMRKTGIDMRRTLFSGILNAFGGNLNHIIVGGAPLDPEIIRDFDAFGITVVEGYGITECCPLISVNPFKWRKFGSAGLVADGLEARIDEPSDTGDGEIQVRGGNVFMGYYKNDEATKEAFTEDGWFRTGDIGHIDKDNFIYITGRKKNVIIASNGKNVYPEELEEYLNKSPIIKEAAVIGRKSDDGVVITALIYPDKDVAGDVSEKELYEKIFSEINLINKGLPTFKHITAIEIRDSEFEKTTTRKIKRFLLK